MVSIVAACICCYIAPRCPRVRCQKIGRPGWDCYQKYFGKRI